MSWLLPSSPSFKSQVLTDTYLLCCCGCVKTVMRSTKVGMAHNAVETITMPATSVTGFLLQGPRQAGG